MLGRGLVLMLVCAMVVPVAAEAATEPIHRTELVSISNDGVGGNGVSLNSSISGDGRYVAFASGATNLAEDDDNGFRDIFVRDTVTGTTTLVSRATGGAIADSGSVNPSISDDGRYVAFESWATNLGGGAVNRADIFVHDRETGTTSLVSKATNGDAGLDGSHYPSISGDGSRVAFYSFADNFSAVDDNSVPNAFVRDLDSETTILVSKATDGTAGDGESVNPAISADGGSVAFQSMADNLVAGSPDADNTVDVFVHRIDEGTTTFVSKSSDGTPGSGDSTGDSGNPSLSADGRFVAFASRADTLVPDDALFLSDVFVHDTDTGETSHISKASDGTPGTGPPFGSYNPSISADGRYVAFDSTFTNLSEDDFVGEDIFGVEVADIFVHDRVTGETRYASRSTSGIAGDRPSYLPSISADGRYVAFESHADTLSPDDSPNLIDVFLHKLMPVPPTNLTPPDMTGPGTVGAQLSCDAGTWDGGTVTRAWRRDGTPIPGETGPTYTTVPEDAGSTIECLVTVSNEDGRVSLIAGSLVIPGSPVDPGDRTDPERPGPRADTTAPRLSRVSLNRKRLRTGPAKRRGTTLRFRLSERATVRIVVQRRAGKRWRAAGRIHRKSVGGGARKIRIAGRSLNRRLVPGRYRVRITATDPSGNRSATVRRGFRIVR